MSDSNGYVCLDKHSRVVANHLVCYPEDAMNMIARQAGCKTAALLPASSRTRALQFLRFARRTGMAQSTSRSGRRLSSPVF